MEISFSQKPSKAALVIYPVFKRERVKNPVLAKLIPDLAAAKEFSAGSGQIFFAYKAAKMANEKVILVGMGGKEKLSVAGVMQNLGMAMKSAMTHKSGAVAVFVPNALRGHLEACAAALALSSYSPAAPYKTGAAQKKLQKHKVVSLELFADGGFSERERGAAKRGFFAGQTENEVKDWVNAPPNFANIAFFESLAKKIAKETGAKLTILRKKELQKLGMGALLGVNKGGKEGAALMILDFNPHKKLLRNIFKKDPAPIAFIGKGIIFDSGGYNLKPSGHIEDMNMDKAGAAAVFGLAKALKRMGISRRVIAAAPFTENLIGENAIKPSEIIKTYSGKTVEVTNTDAEGRLILADAISYVVDKYKPEALIDAATLTGACVVALGDRYAGILGNNDSLMKKLQKAGDEVDELLWPLPIHRDYEEKMKGVYADLCNSDSGPRGAGTAKGAAFIREFVGKTPWAHLDIAGTAHAENPKKYEQKGATGWGVRLFLRFLENLGDKNPVQ